MRRVPRAELREGSEAAGRAGSQGVDSGVPGRGPDSEPFFGPENLKSLSFIHFLYNFYQIINKDEKFMKKWSGGVKKVRFGGQKWALFGAF